VISAGPLAPKT